MQRHAGAGRHGARPQEAARHGQREVVEQRRVARQALERPGDGVAREAQPDAVERVLVVAARDEEVVEAGQLAGRHAVDHLEEVGVHRAARVVDVVARAALGQHARRRRQRQAGLALGRAGPRRGSARRRSAGTGSAVTRARFWAAFSAPNSGVASASTSRTQSAVMVIAMALPEVFWMSSMPMHERKSRMLCCQQLSVQSARVGELGGLAALASACATSAPPASPRQRRAGRRGSAVDQRRQPSGMAAACVMAPPLAPSSTLS